MLLWGAFAILCSVFLGVFDASPGKSTIGQRFGKALGLVLFIIGSIEIVGVASGSTNVLEPLSTLHGATAAMSGEKEKITFTRITTVEDLDKELLATTTPVMLDFYADWCVSCKEMDKFTFHDPKVVKQLKGVKLLQVDVTANTPADLALMKRFGLFGPPGMIFFDRTGKEIPDGKIAGFLDATPFVEHINKIITEK
jgi:thiol:disulfide interchange protein DsbD